MRADDISKFYCTIRRNKLTIFTACLSRHANILGNP